MYSLIKRTLKGTLPPPWLSHLRALKNWVTGEPELRLLPLLCDKNRVAIDVGANVGVYTYFLKKYSAATYAFEPHPRFAQLLRESFGKGVVVEEYALSDQAGNATLTVPLSDNSEDTGLGTIEPTNNLKGLKNSKYKIACKTLDSFSIGPVGLIKIDVEGHELSVLKGANGIITRDNPNILVEMEERHRPNTIVNSSNFLKEKGYRGFYFLKGKLNNIDNFKTEKFQNPAHITPLGKRGNGKYINNFIFIKDERVLNRIEKLNN